MANLKQMFSVSYELDDVKDIRLTAFFIVLFSLKENIAVFLVLNYEDRQFKWFSSIS